MTNWKERGKVAKERMKCGCGKRGKKSKVATESTHMPMKEEVEKGEKRGVMERIDGVVDYILISAKKILNSPILRLTHELNSIVMNKGRIY